jgi:NTE family protein
MDNGSRRRVAVACQGGGSHTAFTAGVLQGLMEDIPDDVEVIALSGTSGGAICAALAWDGLIRNDTRLAAQKLKSFWDSMAARDTWDRVTNEVLLAVMSLSELMVLPEVSPYRLPTWGEEQFRRILDMYFDFPELRRLAERPGAPSLQIGAVEVLTGHFELFTGKEICPDFLLASAAIPEMFRAVAVPGRGAYWDGLFSQNPPLHDLADHKPDEIWLIQINSSTCPRVPTENHEIRDRRNQLAGNLSMEQELRFIESINRKIAQGTLTDPRYRPIRISRIALDRTRGYLTKLDRRPAFIDELREFGRAKWRMFAKQRTSSVTGAPLPGPVASVDARMKA